MYIFLKLGPYLKKNNNNFCLLISKANISWKEVEDEVFIDSYRDFCSILLLLWGGYFLKEEGGWSVYYATTTKKGPLASHFVHPVCCNTSLLCVLLFQKPVVVI